MSKDSFEAPDNILLAAMIYHHGKGDLADWCNTKPEDHEIVAEGLRILSQVMDEASKQEKLAKEEEEA